MAQENDTKQPVISKLPVFLAGAGLGLIACYMLDPEHGATRRKKLRDQGSKAAGEGAKRIESGWRAALHRITGFFQEFAHRGPSMAEVTDALQDPKSIPAVKKAADTVEQLSH